MRHLGGGSKPQKGKLLLYFMTSQNISVLKAKLKLSKLIFLNHMY